MYNRYNSLKFISLAILFNLFSILFISIPLNAQKKFIFNIRIDDIQSRGTQDPKEHTYFFRMVAKHNAKITWCVYLID